MMNHRCYFFVVDAPIVYGLEHAAVLDPGS